MPDAELMQAGALRMTADGNGYPCRVSLTDAAVGDPVILVNYMHHRTDTPYRANFAIYVRPGEQTYDAMDQVPQMLRRRLLSVRAYDATGMLRNADVVAGTDLERVVQALFEDSHTQYLHVHFALPGCYAALVERA
jgi:aminoglycoside phosphotransferase (APT) family kinase protein